LGCGCLGSHFAFGRQDCIGSRITQFTAVAPYLSVMADTGESDFATVGPVPRQNLMRLELVSNQQH
jgi:hypothetical protein